MAERTLAYVLADVTAMAVAVDWSRFDLPAPDEVDINLRVIAGRSADFRAQYAWRDQRIPGPMVRAMRYGEALAQSIVGDGELVIERVEPRGLSAFVVEARVVHRVPLGCPALSAEGSVPA